MEKPGFIVTDELFVTFLGYQLLRYLPPHTVFRAKYFFAAGIFEWWRKHFDYSLVLKLSIHGKRLMDPHNQNMTYAKGESKTAVAILTLIPGFGLHFSFTVFI